LTASIDKHHKSMVLKFWGGGERYVTDAFSNLIKNVFSLGKCWCTHTSICTQHNNIQMPGSLWNHIYSKTARF